MLSWFIDGRFDSALKIRVIRRVSHVVDEFLDPYVVLHRFQKQDGDFKQEWRH